MITYTINKLISNQIKFLLKPSNKSSYMKEFDDFMVDIATKIIIFSNRFKRFIMMMMMKASIKSLAFIAVTLALLLPSTNQFDLKASQERLKVGVGSSSDRIGDAVISRMKKTVTPSTLSGETTTNPQSSTSNDHHFDFPLASEVQ